MATLFSYAKAQKYVPKDHDEMDNVPVTKDRGGEIGIFTPAEMAELPSSAGPDLIPFLALGAFAGVRHAEIQRLNWEDVKLQDGTIQIRAGNAKTASRRVIPLLDNLKAWLLPHWREVGLVCRHRNMADEIIDLVRAANQRRQKENVNGEFKWKHNALRHSFVSYGHWQVHVHPPAGNPIRSGQGILWFVPKRPAENLDHPSRERRR